MKNRLKFRLVLGLVIPFLISISPALTFAQGERGALNGIVTDPTGAVVPNAEVTALHKETNV
jgi:hypothetical protein